MNFVHRYSRREMRHRAYSSGRRIKRYPLLLSDINTWASARYGSGLPAPPPLTIQLGRR